jgi:protein-disulfide isomerase
LKRRSSKTAIFLVAITSVAWSVTAIYAQSHDDERPVNERGPVDASVTVVEYCRYDSEVCARLNIVITSVLREYEDRVRFVFRYLPPADGPDDSVEHYATYAAGVQGQFWPMHDMLFANRGRTAPTDLVAMAKQLRLDAEKFRADLNSQVIRDAAKHDSEMAAEEGITIAPTVVVNGRRLTNVNNARDLRPAIQEALAR